MRHLTDAQIRGSTAPTASDTVVMTHTDAGAIQAKTATKGLAPA